MECRRRLLTIAFTILIITCQVRAADGDGSDSDAGSVARRAGWLAALDIFNLLDTRWNDIEYYCVSPLPNEAAPRADFEIHPGIPCTLRLRVEYRLWRSKPVFRELADKKHPSGINTSLSASCDCRRRKTR